MEFADIFMVVMMDELPVESESDSLIPTISGVALHVLTNLIALNILWIFFFFNIYL